MANASIIEHVTDGGMISLKEIPNQEKVHLADKYFDQFTTYAPFSWLGSRRLTAEELLTVNKRKCIINV